MLSVSLCVVEEGLGRCAAAAEGEQGEEGEDGERRRRAEGGGDSERRGKKDSTSKRGRKDQASCVRLIDAMRRWEQHSHVHRPRCASTTLQVHC
jgi:hypothetical protein